MRRIVLNKKQVEVPAALEYALKVLWNNDGVVSKSAVYPNRGRRSTPYEPPREYAHLTYRSWMKSHPEFFSYKEKDFYLLSPHAQSAYSLTRKGYALARKLFGEQS